MILLFFLLISRIFLFDIVLGQEQEETEEIEVEDEKEGEVQPLFAQNRARVHVTCLELNETTTKVQIPLKLGVPISRN